jgi:hypothetical protein
MQTKILSALGFIATLIISLIASYFKGKGQAKLEQKTKNNEEAIKILQDQKETAEFVDTLTESQLDKLLRTKTNPRR